MTDKRLIDVPRRKPRQQSNYLCMHNSSSVFGVIDRKRLQYSYHCQEFRQPTIQSRIDLFINISFIKMNLEFNSWVSARLLSIKFWRHIKSIVCCVRSQFTVNSFIRKTCQVRNEKKNQYSQNKFILIFRYSMNIYFSFVWLYLVAESASAFSFHRFFSLHS